MESILMESILTGSIFFRGAFCFGEHFEGSILFRGAFFGEHFTGSIWRGAFVRRASDPESFNLLQKLLEHESNKPTPAIAGTYYYVLR